MLRVVLTILAILVAATASAETSESNSDRVLQLFPAKCRPGLHHQPGGPFAVLIFCENALGSHIGVVYYDNLANPFVDSWGLTDRFWQQPAWAADVDSLAWSPDGKFLYVATGEVYGTGGLFALDLRTRTWRRIEPPGSPDSTTDSGIGFHILGVDPEAGVLRYSPGAGSIELPTR